MSFYPAVPPAVTPAPGEDAAAELLGRAVMVAVRLGDLASPAGPGLGEGGRPGVSDEIARDVTLKGKIKGNKRRAVTPALAIRFVLLMTLMPAHYAEVMAALIGDLATVPWHRPCALPTAAVVTSRIPMRAPAKLMLRSTS